MDGVLVESILLLMKQGVMTSNDRVNDEVSDGD